MSRESTTLAGAAGLSLGDGEEEGALIDAVAAVLDVATDQELESSALMARNTLSKARRGAQQLGPWNRAKLLCLGGFPSAERLAQAIFGSKARDWIAEAMYEQGVRSRRQL
jgi:hypothetical protein